MSPGFQNPPLWASTSSMYQLRDEEKGGGGTNRSTSLSLGATYWDMLLELILCSKQAVFWVVFCLESLFTCKTCNSYILIQWGIPRATEWLHFLNSITFWYLVRLNNVTDFAIPWSSERLHIKCEKVKGLAATEQSILQLIGASSFLKWHCHTTSWHTKITISHNKRSKKFWSKIYENKTQAIMKMTINTPLPNGRFSHTHPHT